MATCPACAAPLAADGACPRCLLAAGLTPSPVAGPHDADELERLVPDHEIGAVIGRGGMGTVYRARHRRLDRPVALKILPLSGALPGAAGRFAVEARALARLDHPHIVRVHDAGHAGDLCWLSMELVDGSTLRNELARRRLEPGEALVLAQQLCSALQYAHDHGVVHRDIKPENILIDRRGRAMLADFGLARIGDGGGGERLTRPDAVMGTPHYMAPEQVERPLAVDHRADLFALGVVLYEMLTGELPLGRFPPPSRRVTVDVRLDEVVLRALEKAPELRWQQAGQIGGRIARILAGPRRPWRRWLPVLALAAPLAWWLLRPVPPPAAGPGPRPPAADAGLVTLAETDAGLLRDERFATLSARFDPTLAQRLPAVELASLWRGLAARHGPCHTTAPTRLAAGGRTATRCRFGEREIDLILVYDAAGRIGGLWLLDPPP